ncbi:putative terpene synthase 2 [Senna tora]|uniref:Putative terpene synthase 2 n=1 Tax=Senna tora TaxID=362788 RepID=A0A834WMX5_9FABA|nr:putative terpene synthase 2 [Senna tora]
MSSTYHTSEIVRPTADFSPSIWKYHFLSSASPPPLMNDGELEIQQRLQHLKDQVGRLLLPQVDEDPSKILNLIDIIQRLGVSYHFQSEIDNILQDMYKNPPPFHAKIFTPFPSGFVCLDNKVFMHHQFRDENGDFKRSLTEDMVGMLSLYEAAHLGTHEDLVTKVPYSRDRIVEAYFMALTVDDTYDAYGTIDELQVFTEAFQRWDASPVDPLPECMKVVFGASLELYKEIELLIAGEGNSCFLQYVKRAFQRLVEAYLVEAKWCNQGYIPTYEEYMENGIVSCVYPWLQTASFLGLGNCATKDVFDWISNYPKIGTASAIIARLGNDITSHKFERERVHVASAVECLMNQHGISEADAYKCVKKDMENAWKDINEECLKVDGVPKAVLECIVNFSRMMEVVYKSADKYTNAELLKDHIAALLVDPMHGGNEQNK